jgi:hypothetical protein
MTDLHTRLLEASRPGAEPAAYVVDQDVARGRRALARRNMRRVGTRGVLVAAAAVGTLVITQTGGGTSHPGQAATQTAGSRTQLVAYTGTQPKGFTVDSVPSGWEIQGVNGYALTIAANGDPDQSLDSFAGKLAVMLLSKSASIPTSGTHVSVGATTGIVSHVDPSTAQLFYTDAAGHAVVIQVPASLHWTDQEIGEFGSAVHVNASAQAGVG